MYGSRAISELTKIENGQFPESEDVDIADLIREQAPLYNEIYESRHIACHIDLPDHFVVSMNDSLASTLVTNLLKNAYVHTNPNQTIDVVLHGRTLTIANDGDTPLDAEHIFDRFYQGNKKEGSTGLGLALVKAVCHYYNCGIAYRYTNGKHCFFRYVAIKRGKK